jgi:hypothetical protein
MTQKTVSRNLAKKSAGFNNAAASPAKKASKTKGNDMEVDTSLLPKVQPKKPVGSYLLFTTENLRNMSKEL